LTSFLEGSREVERWWKSEKHLQNKSFSKVSRQLLVQVEKLFSIDHVEVVAETRSSNNLSKIHAIVVVEVDYVIVMD
jgi:hypothetical protein